MNTLYSLFEEVIKTKNFKLEEMTRKIKRSYIAGDITAEEHNELLSLVSENLNPETEKPEWFEVVKKCLNEIEVLKGRVSLLEKGEVTPENNTETPKYEKWTPWDGVSNKYQLGDIVEHNGVLYESIYNGMNTWEPGVIGTHGVWKVYEGV